MKLLFALFITVFILGTSSALAQTKNIKVILTWQAQNFFPSNYEGKALASQRTPIALAVEAAKNNKLIDLSKAKITWRVDDRVRARGEGTKEAFFLIDKAFGDNHFVRVSIEIGRETIEESMRIPVVLPSAVIELPYPRATVPQGNEALIRIVPYFFNISSLSDLLFTTQVNNMKQGGKSANEFTLKIGTPQYEDQKTVSLSAVVQNKKNPLEFVKAAAQLFVQ